MSATAEVVSYPGAEQLETENESIVALAQMYVAIGSAEELQAAESLGIDVNVAISKVHSVFDPICDAAYKAHKTATDTRGRFLAPLEAAKRVLSIACGSFRRREQEERERKEAELRAQLAEADQQRRLDIAADLEKTGDTAAAEAVMQTALDGSSSVPAVSLPAPAKTAGASYRDKWVGRLVDEHVFAHWVVGGACPGSDCQFPSRRLYIAFDQGAINAAGQHSKGKMVLPGVKFENVGGSSFSRKGR
jgi:hypothetical protein